jgi:hypothetical protein
MRTSLRDGPQLPTGPTADCTADSAGGLTFDVLLPGEGERWDAALILRPGGRDRGASVRLPLFPSGDGRLRAALPSTVTLAEGRWDGYLALGDQAPRRLRSGDHDLRSLLEREPSAHRTWLGVRIPYATWNSGLALRSWLRWPHAEIRELRPGEEALSLDGRLYGAEVGDATRLEARRRCDGDGAPAAGGADIVSMDVAGTGDGFRCVLPYSALAGSGEWDLWLRTEPEVSVRLARILDDIADKERAVRYPPQQAGGRTVTAYWTDANDLALRLAGAGPGKRGR